MSSNDSNASAGSLSVPFVLLGAAQWETCSNSTHPARMSTVLPKCSSLVIRAVSWSTASVEKRSPLPSVSIHDDMARAAGSQIAERTTSCYQIIAHAHVLGQVSPIFMSSVARTCFVDKAEAADAARHQLVDLILCLAYIGALQVECGALHVGVARQHSHVQKVLGEQAGDGRFARARL